jgi:hypothetical protein
MSGGTARAGRCGIASLRPALAGHDSSPGGIEHPFERLSAMGLDLCDRAKGFSAHRESPCVRTGEDDSGHGH